MDPRGLGASPPMSVHSAEPLINEDDPLPFSDVGEVTTPRDEHERAEAPAPLEEDANLGAGTSAVLNPPMEDNRPARDEAHASVPPESEKSAPEASAGSAVEARALTLAPLFFPSDNDLAQHATTADDDQATRNEAHPTPPNILRLDLGTSERISATRM